MSHPHGGNHTEDTGGINLPPAGHSAADVNRQRGITEATGNGGALDAASQNLHTTEDAIGKAADTIKNLADGKANMVDTAMAVKGAYDAVKGLSGKISESLMMPVMKSLSAFKGQAILPAAKQMDPVMGIDVHMVTIPPSPAPIPMPHPYIGMLFNSRDWISCAINTFKKDALDALPPPAEGDSSGMASIANNKEAIAGIAMGLANMSASVKFGDFIPRAVAGTKTKNIPHIPMGAGFFPAFDAAIAKNDGKAFLGSLFVVADGDPMVGSFHLNYDCWDIGILDLFKALRGGKIKEPEEPETKLELFVPSGLVTPIPLGRPVLVNSIPTPINPLAILDYLFKAGLGKLLKAGRNVAQKVIDKLAAGSKLGCNFWSAVSKAVGTGQSHPVDVAGGYFYTDNEDFMLPGPIPLVWERTWYSFSDYRGPLGVGWHHSYDVALSFDRNANVAAVRMDDGRPAAFEIPRPGSPSYNRAEKLFLHVHDDGYYFLTDDRNLIYRFIKKEFTNPYNGTQSHLLQSISNRNGFAIRFSYQGGLLIQIIDSAGRILKVTNDEMGRINNIETAHPRIPGNYISVAAYRYSNDGDMTSQTDANGFAMLFEYEHHHLVKETWRNGLNWYFRYNKSFGTDAKCIEAWGDGDLLHCKFDYSNPACTVVTNSLGYSKQFFHKNGLVTKYIDPLGHQWKYHYNQFNELEWTTDPLGNQTGRTYDDWGNTSTMTTADGLFYSVYYNHPEFTWVPTEAVDQRGGRWGFTYDTSANLVSVRDPLGGLTRNEYHDGLLISLTNAATAKSLFTYDRQFNLQTVTYADGSVETYEYDMMGNCTGSTDVSGNRSVREFDLLRQLLIEQTPDGNIKQLAYDPIGLTTLYRDQDREIHLEYNGMGKLTRRTEEGKIKSFNYDTENQLVKIINEQFLSYRFQFDAAGRITEEVAFDNLAKTYEHNAAGWITKINLPGEKSESYFYDDGGHLTMSRHYDGSSDIYKYKNGDLVQAANEQVTVIYERDIFGRIIKESSNGSVITNSFDVSSRRTKLNSSMGAEVSMEYDIMGYTSGINANGWQGRIQRDVHGFEIQKHFSGTIVEAWKRDRLGRPQELSVTNTSAGVSSGYFRRYSWGTNEKLLKLNDRDTGSAEFEHDKWGNLSKTIFNATEVQYRNPDTADNLYETQNRKDKKYAPGGRLIESQHGFYEYDAEGRLVKKAALNGFKWMYSWNGAGMLEQVIRPDGKAVSFGYDVLGRRVWKKYNEITTNYLWDNNRVLHEWQSKDSEPENIQELVTWITDENTYNPLLKLTKNEKYVIVSDYMNTPLHAYDEHGVNVWAREMDSYGRDRIETGQKEFCPFRFQGQQFDPETGLSYNRFRYYDPVEGRYISQDPIGLRGGMELYNYVDDPNLQLDVFGLSDSEKLGNNLTKNGEPKPGNYDAHHIVQAGSQKPSMVALRQQMGNYNPPVDINSHDNGIWLPHRSGDRVSGDKSTAHGGDGVHGDDYKNKMLNRLKGLDRAAFLAELAKIKGELRNGATYKIK